MGHSSSDSSVSNCVFCCLQDALNFEGERCGICMDIVINRGVLDFCQHWFCFQCIDNWSTIKNLCPLCQNEFQLFTCVPVYDTIGSSKTDEELSSRDDDWCIEGRNNTLSFPSYYIDKNAVTCLDGDGCKFQKCSISLKEDLTLDTSIACDSCDIWYAISGLLSLMSYVILESYLVLAKNEGEERKSIESKGHIEGFCILWQTT
ncbi:hypothetical protein Ancab_033179 [Ancistrocladus abbreviatus]